MRRERVGFEEEKKRESVSGKKKRRFAGVGESDWWHPTTRSRGQSISENQTIVSQNGNFELGFFAPGSSRKYYIGIWYKKASIQNRVVVWIANRDEALSDSPSLELKLLDNGNLVLLNHFKIPIWSTNNTSKAGNSSELVLGDDGNLVLRDGSDPLSRNLLWQSFDNPTDTTLPGAKTGYDKRTKVSTKLTSWRNSEDPTSGIYTLEATPDGHFGVHWNGSQEYWTTGTWNGRTFSQTPEMRSNSLFNFKRVSNENETYVTYSLNNRAVLSRTVLDLSGHYKQFLWMDGMQDWNVIWSQPLGKCAVYGLCGAFGICSENGAYVCQCLQGFQTKSPKDWDLLDYSGGCVRETSVQCGGKDWFLKVPNVRLPVNSKASKVHTDENCKLACSNDCSCGAYAYTSTGCFTWHGNLLNIQQLDSGGDDLYLRLAASEVSNSGRKVSVVSVIVWLVSGIIALAVILVLMGFYIDFNRYSSAFITSETDG
ncbi:hypothetical protein Sjap_003497 [Stephania japonica]|uniref:Uncharacterized protein n=1 Tax=Stephania japonica TaxID=461633 RepID=A0AAP0KQY7_9MAGN